MGKKRTLFDSLGALRVLTVGINTYNEAAGFPNLRKCVTDARSVAKAFREVSQLMAHNVCCEEDLSRGNIIKGVRELASSATTEERLLLYFSGHGHRIKGRRDFFLVPSDVYSDSDPGAFVPLGSLIEILENSLAKQVIVIVDSCFSGPINLGTKTHAARFSEKSLVKYLARVQGTTVFFSSAANEKSYEQSPSDLSLFTHFLVKGLMGEAAALDCMGLLTTDTLFGFASAEVVKTARSYQCQQTPSRRESTTGIMLIGDFRLSPIIGETCEVSQISPDARKASQNDLTTTLVSKDAQLVAIDELVLAPDTPKSQIDDLVNLRLPEYSDMLYRVENGGIEIEEVRQVVGRIARESGPIRARLSELHRELEYWQMELLQQKAPNQVLHANAQVERYKKEIAILEVNGASIMELYDNAYQTFRKLEERQARIDEASARQLRLKVFEDRLKDLANRYERGENNRAKIRDLSDSIRELASSVELATRFVYSDLGEAEAELLIWQDRDQEYRTALPEKSVLERHCDEGLRLRGKIRALKDTENQRNVFLRPIAQLYWEAERLSTYTLMRDHGLSDECIIRAAALRSNPQAFVIRPDLVLSIFQSVNHAESEALLNHFLSQCTGGDVAADARGWAKEIITLIKPHSLGATAELHHSNCSSVDWIYPERENWLFDKSEMIRVEMKLALQRCTVALPDGRVGLISRECIVKQVSEWYGSLDISKWTPAWDSEPIVGDLVLNHLTEWMNILKMDSRLIEAVNEDILDFLAQHEKKQYPPGSLR